MPSPERFGRYMTGFTGLPITGFSIRGLSHQIDFSQALRNIPHTKAATSSKMDLPATFGATMVGLAGFSTISLAYKCGYFRALRTAPPRDTEENTNPREPTIEDVVLPRPRPAEDKGALQWPQSAVRRLPEHQDATAGTEAKKQAIAGHATDISEIKAKEQQTGPRPSDFLVVGA